jgi:hypothetical protein
MAIRPASIRPRLHSVITMLDGGSTCEEDAG